MPQPNRQPSARRLQAGTVAVFALVQALALQLWCFCGSCPRSFAVGVQSEAAEHDCCRKAREALLTATSQVSGQGCCGDDHAMRSAPAVLHAASHVLPAVAIADLGPQPATLEPVLRLTAVAGWHRPRGPPGLAPPLFSQRTAFLL